MSADFLQNIGAVMLCLVAAVLLRNFGFKGVPVLISVVIVAAVSIYAERVGGLIGGLTDLLGAEGEEYLRSAVKIIGVGYLCGICADLCREMGEGGLATAAAVVGRAEILLIILPYIEKIISLASEVI